MKVLFTGSRDWDLLIAPSRLLHHVTGGDIQDLTVIHGACGSGLDLMADVLCRRLGVTPQLFPADWNGPCREACPPGHRRMRQGGREYCPMAGHYRNQVMVDQKPDAVLAFNLDGSRGTADCVARALTTDADVWLWRIDSNMPHLQTLGRSRRDPGSRTWTYYDTKGFQ